VLAKNLSPQEVHHTLNERTNPTWLAHCFVPILTGSRLFCDVYSVMNNWGANHGALSYGHVGADLIALASMLRIPVCMHNVAEDRIFRPSAWTAFGAMEPQGLISAPAPISGRCTAGIREADEGSYHSDNLLIAEVNAP